MFMEHLMQNHGRINCVLIVNYRLLIPLIHKIKLQSARSVPGRRIIFCMPTIDIFIFPKKRDLCSRRSLWFAFLRAAFCELSELFCPV